MSRRAQLLISTGLIAAFLLLLRRMPGLFADTKFLGAALALEVALIALLHFKSWFLPLLMGIFFWAGSLLPAAGEADSLRWLFLGVAALGGFILWIREPRLHRFGAFHLAAAFCVLSALFSVMVSDIPKISLLKVVSLSLLFLYGSTGARLALEDHAVPFANKLVVVCEWLTYLSAVSYFVFGFGVFGNPNSLGAIISIAAVPVLLWGAYAAVSPAARQRRFFALVLCAALLYRSDSRASILAAASVLVVFTVFARRYRFLFQSLFAVTFLTLAVAVVNPLQISDILSSITGKLLYKSHVSEQRILESRISPWTETMLVVERHPWLGSGFGTSEIGDRRAKFLSSSLYATNGTNREHGSSYLAIAEYLGLLGAIPFAALVLLCFRAVYLVLRSTCRTRSFNHPSIPFALIILAGLVHAGFEDWLFAVGSYLCIFFWVAAFLLVDMVPERHPKAAIASVLGFIWQDSAKYHVGHASLPLKSAGR